jgi:hypothetical protein
VRRRRRRTREWRLRTNIHPSRETDVQYITRPHPGHDVEQFLIRAYLAALQRLDQIIRLLPSLLGWAPWGDTANNRQPFVTGKRHAQIRRR